MPNNIIDKSLLITEPLLNDESISEKKYDVYYPGIGNNLNTNSQTRIIIENQDLYNLPCQSFLTFKGQLLKKDGTEYPTTEVASLANNGILFMYDRHEYSINDKIIECVNNPGRATLMKGLFTYPKGFDGLNSCFVNDTGTGTASLTTNTGFKERQSFILGNEGKFIFVIPLSHIFGFCEDYKKVIYGVKHTLTLTRCGDEDAIFGNSTSKIVLESITWTMINIKPNLEQEYKLNKLIESKTTFDIGYMARTLDEIDVQKTKDFTWRLGPKVPTEKTKIHYYCFSNR